MKRDKGAKDQNKSSILRIKHLLFSLVQEVGGKKLWPLQNYYSMAVTIVISNITWCVLIMFTVNLNTQRAVVLLLKKQNKTKLHSREHLSILFSLHLSRMYLLYSYTVLTLRLLWVSSPTAVSFSALWLHMLAVSASCQGRRARAGISLF